MMAQRLTRLVVGGGRNPWMLRIALTTTTRGAATLIGANPVLGDTSILNPRNCIVNPPVSTRTFSSDVDYNINANPSYQVYGETSAFTIKAIPPEFRLIGSRTVIVDSSKRGRLLFEWTERHPSTGKFAWDKPLRFALSAEEAGLVIAKISNHQIVELNRKGAPQNNNSQFPQMSVGGSLQKVFRALPRPDGSVQLTIDYELDGHGGQEPPSANEAKGPLEVSLMAGEYQVIKSIIEYSLPRLTGWAPMMDHAMGQSFSAGGAGGGSSGAVGSGGPSGPGPGGFYQAPQSGVPF